MRDLILTSAITSIATFAIAFFLFQNRARAFASELQLQLDNTNSAERKIHLKEMEFLSERNKVGVVHAESLMRVRQEGFDEGKKRGFTEREHEVNAQLAKQDAEFLMRLHLETTRAADDARAAQRAENELQAKLFSVKISPYVKLITNKGFVSDDLESIVGYQYQLMVNGIPAFQPHIVVERLERAKMFDENVKKELISAAKTCAEIALSTYLGGAHARFAILAPYVLDNVKK